MDFLENVKDVVGSAAQTVAKKSGEAIEYSKIKYSMYDTGNSIKNLYTQIGEAVYKNYKSGESLSEELSELCSEIDSLGDKLEELSDRLGGMRSDVKCRSCGKNVRNDSVYCPYCGEKLAEDMAAEVADPIGDNASDADDCIEL